MREPNPHLPRRSSAAGPISHGATGCSRWQLRVRENGSRWRSEHVPNSHATDAGPGRRLVVLQPLVYPLAAGWGGLQSAQLNEDMFLLDEVPHDWMFERVAAVVHHGGAGTTAAGLRAGRPTVVCPFFGDQTFWGWRVQELGVGPAPVPQRCLNAERLADAIRQAVESGEMQNRANALGEALRQEDGIACAADFVERTQC